MWSDKELDILKTYTGNSSIETLLPNRTLLSIRQKAHRQGYTSIENQKTASRARMLGSNQNRKYTFNDRAFSEISNESCYWAGFIAADGCITYNRGSLVFSFGLQASDVVAVEQLRAFLQHTGPIVNSIKQTFLSKCIAIFRCTQIAHDLEVIYNITPRKSLTLQPPNLTNPEHIKSFIVGYIDGDGCIMQKPTHIELNVIGTKQVMYWIKNFFDLTYAGKTNQTIRSANRIYSYSVCGKRALLILQDLKTTYTGTLARKWNKLILEPIL